MTIARFRAAFPGAVEDLFASVLVLARLGMGSLGTVALDGSRSPRTRRGQRNDEEGLRKLAAESVAAHAAAAQPATPLWRAGAGRPVPPPGGQGRDERIAAALAQITAGRRERERRRTRPGRRWPAAAPARPAAGERRRHGGGGRLDRAGRPGPRSSPSASAAPPGRRSRAAPDRPRAGAEDYSWSRSPEALGKAQARAAAQASAAARPGRGPVRNITDPDSRLIPTRNGIIQGYNANVTSADGLIIATELTRDTTDTASFEPMLRHAEDAAALITGCQPAPASPDPPARTARSG